MKAELKEEESFHTGPHGEEYFTPDLFLVAILSLSLLHLSVKIWKSTYSPGNSHFCSQCLLQEGKLNLFFDSHLHMCLFFSVSFEMKARVWSRTTFSIP